MTTISIRDAKNRLTELARSVEAGETIVVTRNGRPVMELTPHRPPRGLDLQAGRDFLRAHGLSRPEPSIPEDFDEPLPEDILLRPPP
jgi:prevent-host-death family protein